MRVSSLLLLTFLLVLMGTGCVERYYPAEDDVFTGTLVVSAHLTDKPGIQNIFISRSDRLLYPEYLPESNCLVEVENQEGTVVSFPEAEPGEYTAHLSTDFLQTGYSYRLHLITTDGNIYESEFTRLHPSTCIDSVYTELESQPTLEPGITMEGIRFYIDFGLDPVATEYMRWELVETYEFRLPEYENFIYDVDRVVKPVPPDKTDLLCWITGPVNDLYTLDAGNLLNPNYIYFPLHFVSNESQRLYHGYSLLVRQLSLDEGAFRYWDELKKNSQNLGGLYDRQPSLTPSNICNCDDPEEKILGYFSVSGVSEKRVFVRDVEGLDLPFRIFCFPAPEPPRLRFLMTQDLPVFMARATWPETGETVYGETRRECVDCRVRRGSSGEPPDYWPKQ